ncbi:oxidoreductase domain protein [Beutenbergia cavernae DSM 12333]|uniref:Oxidoreductase domain protein n=1 Tax=Beutenbergia cavernae (strain ATCC BAA-8 / DSM 12333 / CCUG 43141 / JCM 11478 / NBRC 16432 / NCIMB 13614 / HKI 0122) TaxID=471853 RepID=C5C1J5_BEUC1|nr:DUF6807 family protein [Beutenbergia cavernae]ACQ81605.1 oxidoreductase domain protein [Beutenbergia cavernae DSM 12333]
MTSAPSTPSTPSIAVVGARGYGRNHAVAVATLVAEGRARFAGVVDPAPTDDVQEIPAGTPRFATLEDLFAQGVPDVVTIATPIDTHAPIATAALTAGAHVYLEKPPTASFAEFEALRDHAAACGRAVQVGFQARGSHGVSLVRELVADGRIGDVRGIGGVGTWVRTQAYYDRAPWAGHRVLDGRIVMDGVTTNPLAHSVDIAFALDGSSRAEDVAALTVDPYRAHPIETDDTTAVVVTTTRGTRLALGLTTCAPTHSDPVVTVLGTAGEIAFYYGRDVVVVTTPQGREEIAVERDSLLENLLAHVGTGAELLNPIANAGAFMRVLEALRVGPEPARMPDEVVTWHGSGPDAHPVIADIEEWCGRVGSELATFAALGAPWARSERVLAELEDDGARPVARYVAGDVLEQGVSPRPFLHPVWTPNGVVTTDVAPSDHAWHLGAGVAVPDVSAGVGSSNLWGGGTFRLGEGYRWRGDNGRMRHDAFDQHEASGVVERLTWLSSSGEELAHESRTLAVRSLPTTRDDAVRVLEMASQVAPAGEQPLVLGSPASNGRDGAGYGGLFWRVAACSDPDVRTATARGEEGVHGSRDPWLAWSATGAEGPFTLVFVRREGDDPWFVRVAGYPGVGLALAWDAPRTVPVGSSSRQAWAVVVADGIVDDDGAAALAAQLA